MTKSRVQINRSSVTLQRPTGRDPGELYVNWADRQIGVIDPTNGAMDMVAVRFYSPAAMYGVNDFVIYEGELYRAIASSSAGSFSPDNWVSYGLSTTDIDWSQIVNEPATFPPTLPILQTDVIGLTDELAGKLEDAPSDGEQYARQDAAWVTVAAGGSPAWTDITGKPATFPPTLPIAQSGVTNLVSDLAGKAATVHTHAQSDVTGLTTDLAAKLPLAGGTMTGKLICMVPDATNAPLNLGGFGVTPSSPITGDIWQSSGSGLIFRHGTNSLIVANTNAAQNITAVKTFTAPPVMATPTASIASINLPHGVAPTAPVNGDAWSTSAGFFVRVNSVTYQLATLTDLALKANLAGATFTGKVTVPAGAAGGAGLNVGVGSSPSSPAEGDVWISGLQMVFRSTSNRIVIDHSNTQSIGGVKTFTTKPIMMTPAAGTASINLPHGVAPTTPVDGDVWSTLAGGFYGRVNGVTKNLSIHVGTTAPASPITNDLWLDIN